MNKPFTDNWIERLGSDPIRALMRVVNDLHDELQRALERIAALEGEQVIDSTETARKHIIDLE